ncbi:Serine carboxypeptidase F41C3.5 precursor [Aphelenchoides avenae]|nr:Serine carboxypeptidase F41C3.5 precursor [Aphelenchus avenae]
MEAPAGVGFSYFTQEDDQIFDDETTARDNYEALKNFFSLYPQFRNHSVFLTGESYAGIYLPMLAERIVEGQQEFPINLAGMGIGNGLVDTEIGARAEAEFFYSHGFIDERKWADFAACCNSTGLLQCDIDSFDHDCNATYHSMYDATKNARFNAYDIYRNCERYTGDASCTPDLVAYLNGDDVRRALHIPDFVQRWSECDGSMPGYNKTVHSVLNQTKNLLASGVRVLLYYGDTDSMCNFIMGQRFAASLGYKETSQKEPWALSVGLAGFKTDYEGGLTFITVRGVGHMVPQWAPRRAQYFMRQFVQNGPI